MTYAILQALVAKGSSVKIKPEVFQIVFEQWRSQHNVTITYLRAKGGKPQAITIEPHVLTLYDNIWYVRGRAVSGKRNPKHGDFLTFALHRILEAKRNERLFEPDALEIAKVNSGQLFDFPRLENVKLKIWGLARRFGMELLPLESVEEQGNAMIVTLGEIEENRVLNFVLTSNGEADIFEPASLKKKVRTMAQRVVQGLS